MPQKCVCATDDFAQVLTITALGGNLLRRSAKICRLCASSLAADLTVGQKSSVAQNALLIPFGNTPCDREF